MAATIHNDLKARIPRLPLRVRAFSILNSRIKNQSNLYLLLILEEKGELIMKDEEIANVCFVEKKSVIEARSRLKA